jgi:flavin-dependent dehydrogenase
MTRPARVDAEVIVVGGGPAGSALAFRLARAGCDVLLVDRAQFPRDKPCSEYLSPQAGRLLDDMGVLERLENGESARLVGMRITAPGSRHFSGTFGAVRGFEPYRPWGLAIRRTILDHALLSRAREVGVRVRERVQVRDLQSDAVGRVTGVREIDGGRQEVLRAPLVIGADGLRSVVARRARLGAHGRWPRRIAFVAHYRGVRLDGDVGDMSVFRAGCYVGLAPVGGGLTNVALVMPSDRAVASRGDAAGFMAAELARRPSVVERLRDATLEAPPRVVGPFNWRARVAWSPGLALVGDAADFFDPFTGEGIYAALRGAELLTGYAFEAIRAGTGRQADIALEAYDRCRKAEFAGKWAVERLIGAAIAWPAAMDFAARGLAARPDLADRLVGVAGDYVPPSEVLGMRYILALARAGAGFPAGDGVAAQARPATRSA